MEETVNEETGSSEAARESAKKWRDEAYHAKCASTHTRLLLKFTESVRDWAETAFVAFHHELGKPAEWETISPAKRAAWMYGVSAAVASFATQGGIGISDPTDKAYGRRHEFVTVSGTGIAELMDLIEAEMKRDLAGNGKAHIPDMDTSAR